MKASTSLRTRLRVGLLGTGLLVVVLLTLEGVLRLVGADFYPRSSVLAYQEVYTPALRADTAPDGTAILRTWDPRHPWQSLRRERALQRESGAEVLRVLCFGGSAAAGLGFSPNVTFARQLEDLLREGYPGREIEVVNLGTVAIAAKQVRILVEDALEYSEPDAIVVWSGNNEFLAVHAEKYASRHRGLAGRTLDRILGSFLFRGVRRVVRGRPSPADLPPTSLRAADSERMTQARIIQEVVVSELEQREALTAYQAELARIARAARERGVPVVLSGVAVNVEWTGRHGLPGDWMETINGSTASTGAVIDELTRTLAGADLSALDRWQALIRRAAAKDQLGDVQGANEDWRRSCEVDPHQRRATSAIREAAASAAAAEGAVYLDGAALIQGDDPRGRAGFRHFYDYVHFTPRGAAVVATGVYDALSALAGFPPAAVALDRATDQLPTVLATRLERIRDAQLDFYDAHEFLGIGFDPGRLDSTDLWKYEASKQDLNDRLKADPKDWRARVFRGNVRSYSTVPGAGEGALRDWERALEQCGEADAKAIIKRNLEHLNARR